MGRLDLGASKQAGKKRSANQICWMQKLPKVGCLRTFLDADKSQPGGERGEFRSIAL